MTADPAKEKPAALAGAAGADEATIQPDFNALKASTQGTIRFECRTRKTSGAVIVFGVYDTFAEAAAIAQRVGEIGGNGHVVEVGP